MKLKDKIPVVLVGLGALLIGLPVTLTVAELTSIYIISLYQIMGIILVICGFKLI